MGFNGFIYGSPEIKVGLITALVVVAMLGSFGEREQADHGDKKRHWGALSVTIYGTEGLAQIVYIAPDILVDRKIVHPSSECPSNFKHLAFLNFLCGPS